MEPKTRQHVFLHTGRMVDAMHVIKWIDFSYHAVREEGSGEAVEAVIPLLGRWTTTDSELHTEDSAESNQAGKNAESPFHFLSPYRLSQ